MIPFDDALLYTISFFGLYTAIFYLWTLVEHWERRVTSTKRARPWPKVAVIIPCYNEARTVAETIESVLALDYPRAKLDVIVVDDGSTDATYKKARGYVKRGVKVFHKRNGGKHTALNYALERTSAQFVAGLDADSTVASDALKKLVNRFDDENVMAVTPSMKIANPRGVLRRIQTVEFTIGIFLRRVFADLGSQHVTPGPFTVYRRAFFKRHGPYRAAHNTEDIEVALRIQKHDFQIENATDAYVYTHGPATWRSLYKQRLRWYYGFLSNVIDYKELFGRKHGNLGLFVLPSAFLSIFLVIISVAYVLVKTLFLWWDRFIYYKAVGFDVWRMLEFHTDFFLVDTSSVMILGVIGLLVGLALYLVSRHLAQDEEGWTLSYVFFFFIYWLCFGFWWFMAGLQRVCKRQPVWHDKSKFERVNS